MKKETNDELMHYGRKGMHWGEHQDWGTKRSERRQAKINKAIKNKDYRTLNKYRKHLSDDQLRDVTNRVKKENEYKKQYKESRSELGNSIKGNITKSVGTAAGTATAALLTSKAIKSYGSKAKSVAYRKGIALAAKHPRTAAKVTKLALKNKTIRTKAVSKAISGTTKLYKSNSVWGQLARGATRIGKNKVKKTLKMS